MRSTAAAASCRLLCTWSVPSSPLPVSCSRSARNSSSGRSSSASKLAERLQPFQVVVFEPVQHLDREEAVFIHGVAMVEIAQHQRVDGLELRNGKRQQIERMHHAQRVSSMWLHQQLAQVLPQARILRHCVGECAMRVLEPALGFEAQRDPVPGDKSEQSQHDNWIARADGLLQIDPPVHDREFFVGDA